MQHNLALAAHNLSFSYSHIEVLRGVSAQLRFGEVVAIAGPNGSGKSTLLELMAGVQSSPHGRITRHGDLALVVQRPDAPFSLPVTVSDVVAMGTWNKGARMSRLMARAAVAEAIDRVGLRPVARRPLAALSGGQRQRAFLAQGIVRRPDILLLDEPAAGLDRESVERTRRILAEEAARGAAVACVTHDDAVIADADRVIRLEDGIRVA